MKKVSGNLAYKSSETGPVWFVDGLNESRQLRKRLRATVDELKEMVVLLKQNLQEAHRSALPLRKARERSSGKANPGNEVSQANQ